MEWSGGDEVDDDGDDDDDDTNEVQLDDGDDGDDFPPPGRNFPGRFLPAGELFSLWCLLPRNGGGIFLSSLPEAWGSREDEIREEAPAEVGQGGLTMPRRGLGLARAWGWCGPAVAPSGSPSGSLRLRVK